MTLLLGANLPDVDVLAYLWGPAAGLAFRRGWTHGVLALALWPFALTGAMLLVGRLIRRLRPVPLPPLLGFRRLLLLSAVSIFSHPILDSLNTYGVRWLMPFSSRWFYGDTLFIIDPWLWLVLGAGLLLSRRGGRPPRMALVLAGAYVAVMASSASLGRASAIREVTERTGEPVDALMLSPVPVTPFQRTVVAAQGSGYRVGQFRWLEDPRLAPDSLLTYPAAVPQHPAVAAAAATTVGRRFLSWARFPYFQVEADGAGRYLVHIVDLRYTDRPGASFGAVSIPVSPAAWLSPTARLR